MKNLFLTNLTDTVWKGLQCATATTARPHNKVWHHPKISTSTPLSWQCLATSKFSSLKYNLEITMNCNQKQSIQSLYHLSKSKTNKWCFKSGWHESEKCGCGNVYTHKTDTAWSVGYAQSSKLSNTVIVAISPKGGWHKSLALCPPNGLAPRSRFRIVIPPEVILCSSHFQCFSSTQKLNLKLLGLTSSKTTSLRVGNPKKQ
jgi:hypothetical protein